MPKKSRRIKQKGERRADHRGEEVDWGQDFLIKYFQSMTTVQEQEECIKSTLHGLRGCSRESTLDTLLDAQFQAAPYFHLYSKAHHDYLVVNEDKKDLRRAADIFWNAFKQATQWGGLWAPGRVEIMRVFKNVFVDMMQTPQHSHLLEPKDASRFKRVLYNEDELKTIRMFAAFCIYYVPSEMMDHEEKLEHFRYALIAEPTPEEKAGRRVVCCHDSSKDEHVQCISGPLMVYETHVASFKRMAIENGRAVYFVDQEGCFSYEVVPAEMDPDFHRRTTQIGGCECDYCHKTVEELGVTKLEFCSQCENAYYCGVDCQRKAWKQGHKEACRPEGCIFPDDVMHLKGLSKQTPELNGRLVKVERYVDSGCWEVSLLKKLSKEDSLRPPFSVKAYSLLHIRPAA